MVYMKHGACASGDVHSARAGAEVLAAGGNAVDAMVAAGLMACVTLPTMTSLGGGGIMTMFVDGRVSVCDGFASQPGLGLKHRGERELDIVTVNFEGIDVDFRVRAPSIAVPGTVAGLWAVHERHGRMPLAEVAAPAIESARHGYEVTAGQTKAFALLAEIYRMTPGTWALLSNGEAVAQPGEVLRNAPLADTLACLVEDGEAAFYEGDIACAIVEAGEGWVTPQDLATYAAVFRKPLHGRYRDWHLRAPAMPSVTGGMLFAALKHLEAGGPLPRVFDVPAWERIVGAMRTMEEVRTPEYEHRLFEEGFLQAMLAACAGGNTMHISTADGDGNLVGYTTTVGESAGLVAPGTGVVLNNFLGEEDISPSGKQTQAGRRMMTSMCPLLLSNGAGRRFALGSAGSARIKTALLQIVLHLVDGGVDPAEAVRRSRLHLENDTLYIEGWGRTRDEVDALRPLGRRVESTTACGFYFGGAQVVEHAGASFDAGADEDRRGCVALIV